MEKKNRAKGMGAFFVLCWITYMTAYLCRVNMSGALDKLGQALGQNTESLGLIGSLYFVIYAVGQLVNGFLGDRFSPYGYIPVAIAGTTVINVAVGLCGEALPITVLWAVNGVFQSMFWGPMLRVLSQRTQPEKLAAVSAGMAASYLAGYVVSWVALGFLLKNLAWNWHFFVPAVLMVPLFVLWVWQASKKMRRRGEKAPVRRKSVKETLRCMHSAGVLRYVPVCLCLGLIKESVSYWAPVLFALLLPESGNIALLSLGLIPLANYVGLWISKRLVQRMPAKRVLIMLFIAMAANAGVMLLVQGAWPVGMIGLIALASALSYGINNLLLGYIPMSHAKDGIVSSLIGVLDFSSYAGAAISTYVLGYILSAGSALHAPIVWLAAAVGALSLLALGKSKKGL